MSAHLQITSLVEKKYATLKHLLKNKLAKVNRIAFTTDIATVMNSTRSFIVLTGHFIGEPHV